MYSQVTKIHPLTTCMVWEIFNTGIKLNVDKDFSTQNPTLEIIKPLLECIISHVLSDDMVYRSEYLYANCVEYRPSTSHLSDYETTNEDLHSYHMYGYCSVDPSYYGCNSWCHKLSSGKPNIPHFS